MARVLLEDSDDFIRETYGEEFLQELKEAEEKFQWSDIIYAEMELNSHKFGVPIPKSEDF